MHYFRPTCCSALQPRKADNAELVGAAERALGSRIKAATAATCSAPRVQVSPIQCGGKNAKSSGDKRDHDDVCWHQTAPSVLSEEAWCGGANESFDPNQMGVLKGVTSTALRGRLYSIVCRQRRKHSASSFDMAHSLKVAARCRSIRQDSHKSDSMSVWLWRNPGRRSGAGVDWSRLRPAFE